MSTDESPHDSRGGTLGYMSPELSRTGKPTTSSDVFAFGALLLEVACGRRPIEPDAPPMQLNLVDWVRECWARGELLGAADPRLGKFYDGEEMELVLKLGLVCCQSAPEVRPSMRRVIRYLNGDENLADDVSLVFSERESVNLASGDSCNSSCGIISTSSLNKGSLGNQDWSHNFYCYVDVLGTVISIFFYLKQRAKLAETLEDWELDHPHRFRYKDLYKATKGFKETELLGRGGFGHVFKGVIKHAGEEVAVKKISHNTRQGIREFIAEIASLGRMRHRHLVELKGWCKRNEDLLLVYEFMPKGSLDMLLFDSENSTILSWQQRFKILKGVAAGILYLHEEWEQVVVHRDIKASNVLLDATMDAKISDFGLARLYEHGNNLHTTHVVGTLGYMAPEVSRTGRSTTSSDVFAFGALLLEVACGRRPIKFEAPPNELSLVDWVRECQEKGELLQVADSRLQKCYNKEEMELVLKLGLVCCQSVPEVRPSMKQVIQYLNGDEHLADDADLIFSEGESLDLASVRISYASSYAMASTSSLTGGR
uniref:non-specific serine/threonine protein kinase n=1 Tax=Ananas comosus var. bracteatus TaxID=296719 RepID=A0A6V7P8F0_ANACO|nr:unnamed protein product [Ananas comosus var. bracteatus]